MASCRCVPATFGRACRYDYQEGRSRTRRRFSRQLDLRTTERQRQEVEDLEDYVVVRPRRCRTQARSRRTGAQRSPQLKRRWAGRCRNIRETAQQRFKSRYTIVRRSWLRIAQWDFLPHPAVSRRRTGRQLQHADRETARVPRRLSSTSSRVRKSGRKKKRRTRPP